MHEFELIPEMSDGDRLVYRHVFVGSDGSRWVTEAAGNPHVSGYRVRVLRKGDRYYTMENSYIVPFANERGYQIIVEIPSHHEITSASSADGKSIVIDPDENANTEFQQWYEAIGADASDDTAEEWLTIEIENFFGAADLNT